MTVASETNRSGPYNGNGVTTAFDYDFRIVDEDHVSVVRATSDGVETVLVINVDYTVTGVGDPGGGQVLLAVPLAVGLTVTLVRSVPFIQETDLENQGAYNAEDVEDALDLAAMRDQQLQEQIDRSIKVGVSQDIGDIDQLVNAIIGLSGRILTPAAADPTTRDNGDPLQSGDLYFNTVQEEMRVYDGSGWKTAASLPLNISIKSFVGDGVATIFALDALPGTVNNLFVTVGGVIQKPVTDYTVSGTALTFTTAPGNALAIDTWVIATTSTLNVPADESVDDAKVASTYKAKIVGVAANRTALAAMSGATYLSVDLMEAGRKGRFQWDGSNLSAMVTLDTQQGIYVAPSSAPTGASGAWVRQYSGRLDITAFGAVQDGTTDDSPAAQCSLELLGYAIVRRSKGANVKFANPVRLKNAGDELIGEDRPNIIQGTDNALRIEHSFQTIKNVIITGTAAAVNTPAIRIRTSIRSMTTILIEDVYGEGCGAGIMDDDHGTNRANFVTFDRLTFAQHRGYGIATWDCWASFHMNQVVIDRVGQTGANYNYPGFYINGSEGVFHRNCAHNGSSATSVQTLQDGAVFDTSNFVVVENFIPDHVGGDGLKMLTCNNVKVSSSTMVNIYGHGFVASSSTLLQLHALLCTGLVGGGAANKDGFALTSCTTVRASALYAYGFSRNGIFGASCSRMKIEGEFSLNVGRGIVTTGGSVNLFLGCVTASNTAGNYSLASTTDYLRDHILSSGVITADIVGPAAA